MERENNKLFDQLVKFKRKNYKKENDFLERKRNPDTCNDNKRITDNNKNNLNEVEKIKAFKDQNDYSEGEVEIRLSLDEKSVSDYPVQKKYSQSFDLNRDEILAENSANTTEYIVSKAELKCWFADLEKREKNIKKNLNETFNCNNIDSSKADNLENEDANKIFVENENEKILSEKKFILITNSKETNYNMKDSNSVDLKVIEILAGQKTDEDKKDFEEDAFDTKVHNQHSLLNENNELINKKEKTSHDADDDIIAEILREFAPKIIEERKKTVNNIKKEDESSINNNFRLNPLQDCPTEYYNYNQEIIENLSEKLHLEEVNESKKNEDFLSKTNEEKEFKSQIIKCCNKPNNNCKTSLFEVKNNPNTINLDLKSAKKSFNETENYSLVGNKGTLTSTENYLESNNEKLNDNNLELSSELNKFVEINNSNYLMYQIVENAKANDNNPNINLNEIIKKINNENEKFEKLVIVRNEEKNEMIIIDGILDEKNQSESLSKISLTKIRNSVETVNNVNFNVLSVASEFNKNKTEDQPNLKLCDKSNTPNNHLQSEKEFLGMLEFVTFDLQKNLENLKILKDDITLNNNKEESSCSIKELKYPETNLSPCKQFPTDKNRVKINEIYNKEFSEEEIHDEIIDKHKILEKINKVIEEKYHSKLICNIVNKSFSSNNLKQEIKTHSNTENTFENLKKEKRIKQNAYASAQKRAPWLSIKTLENKGSSKLHCEIQDFFEYIKPQEADYQIRREAFRELNSMITNKFKTWRVKTFGSFHTNLFLKNSDIDLVVFTKQSNETNAPVKRDKYYYNSKYNNTNTKEEKISNEDPIRLLYKFLASKNTIIRKIYARKSAKVPIITFVYKGKVKVDISFDKQDGIKNSQKIKGIVKQMPFLRMFFLVIKFIFHQAGLIDVFGGKISSYVLFLLVYVFVNEYIFEIHTADEFENKQRIMQDFNFGLLFQKFFQCYGYKIDYQDIIINPNGKTFFIKKQDYMEYLKDLGVENPHNKSNKNKTEDLNNINCNNNSNYNKLVKHDLYSCTKKFEVEEIKDITNSWLHSPTSSLNTSNNNNLNNIDSNGSNIISLKNETKNNWNIVDSPISEVYDSWFIPDDPELQKQVKLASDFNYDLPYEEELRKKKHCFFIDENRNLTCKTKSSNIYVLGLDDKNGENIARNLSNFRVVHEYIKSIRDHLFYPNKNPFVSYFELFVDAGFMEEYRNLNSFT